MPGRTLFKRFSVPASGSLATLHMFTTSFGRTVSVNQMGLTSSTTTSRAGARGATRDGPGNTITIKGVPGLDAEKSELRDPQKVVFVFPSVPGNLDIRMDGQFNNTIVEIQVQENVGGSVSATQGQIHVGGDIRGGASLTQGSITVHNGDIFGRASTVMGSVSASGRIGQGPRRPAAAPKSPPRKRKREDRSEVKHEPKARKGPEIIELEDEPVAKKGSEIKTESTPKRAKLRE